MLRTPLIICLFLASIYGCSVVLLQDYPLYYEGDWRYYAFMLAPWVFLLFTIKSWYRCFIWRRMLDARQISHALSRGGYSVTNMKARPSILERLCLGFMLFAIAAILKTLFIQNIAWWIGAIFISCLLCRIVTIAVRRS